MNKGISTAALLLLSYIPNNSLAQNCNHDCSTYQSKPGLSCEQRITTFNFYQPRLSLERTQGSVTTCHPHFQYQGSCLQQGVQKARCAGEGALAIGTAALCGTVYGINKAGEAAYCGLNAIGNGFDCLGKGIGRALDSGLECLDKTGESLSRLKCKPQHHFQYNPMPRACEPACIPQNNPNNIVDPFLQQELKEKQRSSAITPLVNPDNGPWNNKQ